VVLFLPPVPLSSVAASVGAPILGDPATAVRDAGFDARSVAPGSLFFCIPGDRVDGHAFAAQARDRGAVALVVERRLEVDLPQVLVPSVRAAMGPMSSVVFGAPAASMRTVGITGTNGKTTISYILEAIFRGAGLVPGVIGTTGARIAGEPTPLAHTTPEAPDLNRLLARMRDAGVGALAMEVSSHALAMGRVDGVLFDVALFTNLSLDHLDFHGTMEEYYAAKASLFTPEHAAWGVINVDDPWGRRLRSDSTIPTVGYALQETAEHRAADVVADREGVAFTIEGSRVRSPLRGEFNASNCLAAIVAAGELGIERDVAVRAVAAIGDVPGRMETLEAGQEFLVVVDYAHTPDSIRSVLVAARALTGGRVIVVFGCGGDRDRDKRPQMGRAATSSADLTIVTTDNPRSEDPAAIIAEILPGAEAGGGAFRVEPDRRRAIEVAVGQARPGDVVVIAGRGHETVQERADGSIEFDDRVVALEALSEVAR